MRWCMHNGGALPTTKIARPAMPTVQNGKAAIIGDFVAGKNHHGAVPGLTANCIGCHIRPGRGTRQLADHCILQNLS